MSDMESRAVIVFASKIGLPVETAMRALCALAFLMTPVACDSPDSAPAQASAGVTSTDGDNSEVSQQAAVPLDEPLDDAVMELGVNVTGNSTPDSFSPLLDGGDLFVELGFQGSYMVVLAFRTKGFVSDGKVNLLVSLSVDGDVKANLKYKKKSLLPGPDGFQYFYNIFLVTEDYLDYVDGEAEVTIDILTLEDDPIVSVDGSVVVRPPL